jgi:hypothetical protein
MQPSGSCNNFSIFIIVQKLKFELKIILNSLDVECKILCFCFGPPIFFTLTQLKIFYIVKNYLFKIQLILFTICTSVSQILFLFMPFRINFLCANMMYSMRVTYLPISSSFIYSTYLAAGKSYGSVHHGSFFIFLLLPPS